MNLIKYTSSLIIMLCGITVNVMAGVIVICPKDATPREKLAEAEIVRYVYLRTGQLPTTGDGGDNLIVLGRDAAKLGAQQFEIKTAGKKIVITGGDDVGVLYGAYRYCEKLGVRFYLHGDVVPDEQLKELPEVNEAGKPLFNLRGVNPWGSHPFGFDAWSTDDYKAIFSQLTKMRMNFLGIHCYPEGHPYAEPTVWLGAKDDFDAQGRVKFSYVSRYFNTLLTPAWGGYRPKRTSEYSFGGAALFDDEGWAPDVLRGYCPLPATPEACNDVFNRMASQFRDAFGFAHELGVKTCVGTEAPLIMPRVLRERLKQQGKNPDDPAVVREIYEGMFRRIAAGHPLDYFWIWTPEGWTWGGNKPQEYTNTVKDVKLAIEALKDSGASFKLATCGWVLGPQHDRAALDNDLPKNIPMSAISRNTGATEVDPAFGRIAGRETWAIPWLESDNRNGLAAIQLEVGRMRRDAADALAYGCAGLMGLQWRTDVLAPNASALALAAWDQGWSQKTEWRVQGQKAVYGGAKIKGTPDEELYRTCRYDLGTIQLAAPHGRYKVTLKFCEPHYSADNERVFDVKVQDSLVITNLDIFAKVGKFAALDFIFDDIAVSDGRLSVKLVSRKSVPCISAIAVEGAGFSSKINCAGGAYKDYRADESTGRGIPCDDFYADWARANFGLEEAGKIFAAVDGKVPQVTDGGCPSGSLKPVGTPWSVMAPHFAFVDEFEVLRSRVRGAGNLDRFEYWLNMFKYHRALAQVRCALAKPDPAELACLWGDTYRYLLATVNTPGGLAMVVNMENHPGWGAAVAGHAVQPWPKEYQGEPRIIVPTVRSAVHKDESVAVKFMVLANPPAKSVAILWRPLGQGEFIKIPAQPVARSVYRATLPPAGGSFEYRIEAVTADGKPLVWPATAPAMNQTVVTW